MPAAIRFPPVYVCGANAATYVPAPSLTTFMFPLSVTLSFLNVTSPATWMCSSPGCSSSVVESVKPALPAVTPVKPFTSSLCPRRSMYAPSRNAIDPSPVQSQSAESDTSSVSSSPAYSKPSVAGKLIAVAPERRMSVEAFGATPGISLPVASVTRQFAASSGLPATPPPIHSAMRVPAGTIRRTRFPFDQSQITEYCASPSRDVVTAMSPSARLHPVSTVYSPTVFAPKSYESVPPAANAPLTTWPTESDNVSSIAHLPSPEVEVVPAHGSAEILAMPFVTEMSPFVAVLIVSVPVPAFTMSHGDVNAVLLIVAEEADGEYKTSYGPSNVTFGRVQSPWSALVSATK